MVDILIILICGFFGTYLTVMNGVIIYRQIRYKSKTSWVPLFGGLFLFITLNSLPYKLPWVIKLLPFIIDWGCIPGLIHTFIYWTYIYPKWRKEGKI